MTVRFPSSIPAWRRRPAFGSLLVALTLSACGGGGGSDATNAQPGPVPSPPPVVTNPQPEPSPPPVASKGSVSLLIGTAGGPGNLDGAGAAARFNGPSGLALGPTGDLYVADSGNARIRKVTPAGVVTTVAGSGPFGFADGPASQATFCDPQRIAIGPDASIFVIDKTRVRKIEANGTVRTIAGDPNLACSFSNAPVEATVAPKSPTGIAVDAFGIAYIADSFAGAVYTLTPAGALTLLAGSENRTNPNPALSSPRDIALDAASNLYVAAGARIARITQTGEVTTLVPSGVDKSPFVVASALARDAEGNLYVADIWGNVVRKVTPAGSVSIVAGIESRTSPFQNFRFDGYESVDGPLGSGRLATPQGVAVAADGTLYVADNFGHTIRRVDPATGALTTLAGAPPRLSPFGPYHAADRAGNVFVAVAVGQRPSVGSYAIQRIAPDGTATTLLPGGLNAPRGMAIDAAGNLYVVDVPKGSCTSCSDNYPLSTVVRKVTPQGETSIFAGRLDTPDLTLRPDVDGTGAAAYLSNAVALAFDPAGNLYVTQAKNHPLRKITPEGVVSTVPVTLPDNSGQYYPSGVAADAAGNVYLSTCNGFKTSLDPVTSPVGAAILKVDPRNQVTELAGSVRAVGYADGPGAQARFANVQNPAGDRCLSGLTLDAAGNLYVSDQGNDVVRKITPAGAVGTVVGRQGLRGVALGALPASLSAATDLSADGAGNLVIGSVDALLKVEFDK